MQTHLILSIRVVRAIEDWHLAEALKFPVVDITETLGG